MSDSPDFSLLNEPWIVARYLHGEVKEVSLRDLLKDAEQIERILGEVATQGAAIFRLVLAIAMCSQRWPNEDGTINPITIERWKELWDDPQQLLTDMSLYLDDYEAEFNLFDPQHPFMQVADLHTAKNELSPVGKIVADIPDGEPFFTVRRGESAQSLSFAEAARWLVHTQAYDTSGIKSGAVGDPRVKGGKGYPIGTGWAGQLGLILIEGKNLAQSLLLNLVADDFYPIIAIDNPDPSRDLPPWERDPDTASVRGTSPNDPVDGKYEPEVMGPVDILTWQSRRVRLHTQGKRVTGVVLAQGDKISPQDKWSVEPMTAWRYSKPQSLKAKRDVYMPKAHYAEQFSWQGLPAIVAQLSGVVENRNKEEVPQFRAASVIRWVGYLLERGYVPDSGLLPLQTVGIVYGSQSASYEALVDDRLLLPPQVVESGLNESHRVLQAAFTATEDVVRAVSQFAVNLSEAAGGSPDTDMRRSIRSRVAERCYFDLNEDFRIWMASLAKDLAGAKQKWKEILQRLAWQQEQELMRSSSLRAFEGTKSLDLGRASVFFWSAVNSALNELHRERKNDE